MWRPHFSRKTMLWLVVVVGALLGGRQIGIQEMRRGRIDELVAEQVKLRDKQVRCLDELDVLLQERKASLENDQRRAQRALIALLERAAKKGELKVVGPADSEESLPVFQARPRNPAPTHADQ
jgi:hypothetical protein